MPPLSGLPAATHGRKIADRLRALRSGKGWTLREASASTGGVLSPSRISNYEQGIREVDISAAEALAKLYGTTAAHILCLDESNPVLSQLEQEHLRNLRALPENQRNEYIRHIASIAATHRDQGTLLPPKGKPRRKK